LTQFQNQKNHQVWVFEKKNQIQKTAGPAYHAKRTNKSPMVFGGWLFELFIFLKITIIHINQVFDF